MPESLGTLIKTVQQLNQSNEDLAADVAALVVTVAESDKKYVKKDVAEKKAVRFKQVIIGIVIAGMGVASCVGFTMFLNHGTTCAVRGILISARASSNRNPLPDNLDPGLRQLVEQERRDAQVFYERSLDKLNIIWPCSGETVPASG